MSLKTIVTALGEKGCPEDLAASMGKALYEEIRREAPTCAAAVGLTERTVRSQLVHCALATLEGYEYSETVPGGLRADPTIPLQKMRTAVRQCTAGLATQQTRRRHEAEDDRTDGIPGETGPYFSRMTPIRLTRTPMPPGQRRVRRKVT